jgi:hypothetical protein
MFPEILFGPIAQLVLLKSLTKTTTVERRTYNAEAAGSKPARTITFWDNIIQCYIILFKYSPSINCKAF